MAEVGIDMSGRKPRKLLTEMQLHADWAVTMGCGDACPYVPTIVQSWDIPTRPACRSPTCATSATASSPGPRADRQKLTAIHGDRTAHELRLAKCFRPRRRVPRSAHRRGDPRVRRRHPRATTRRRSAPTSSTLATARPANACVSRTCAAPPRDGGHHPSTPVDERRRLSGSGRRHHRHPRQSPGAARPRSRASTSWASSASTAAATSSATARTPTRSAP